MRRSKIVGKFPSSRTPLYVQKPIRKATSAATVCESPRCSRRNAAHAVHASRSFTAEMSIPSSRHINSRVDISMLAVSLLSGHANVPCSRRFAKTQKPLRSHREA